MAEEEKASSGGETEWWIWLFGGIIVLALLGNISDRVLNFTSNNSEVEIIESDQVIASSRANAQEITDTIINKISEWFVTFSIPETFPTLTIILYVITGLSLLIFFYSKIQTNWLIAEWDQEIGYNKDKSKISEQPDSNSGLGDNSESGKSLVDTVPKNERWLHIESLIGSDQENDWRSAILEADIMLEELLDNLGYEGKTVAEKLQQVNTSDMKYLAEAWEAHKVRNRIAHDGNAFELDRELFLKTIRQFERVFEEQHII